MPPRARTRASRAARGELNVELERTAAATLAPPAARADGARGRRMVASLAGAPSSLAGASSPAGAPSPRGAVRSLQCLSSGYLTGGRRCERHVPADVVEAGWREELARGSAPGEGFFRLACADGQWLGYGYPDGRVRGVYCPAHAADRDQRAFDAIAAGGSPAPAPQLSA
jgi:hypothetical protein